MEASRAFCLTNIPNVPSFVPGQTMIALFSRVLQKNSAWSFDIVFWLFIFTGRDTSWPSGHSCWSGEHWSHWRNFSGIPFLFGGIYVPVSNSLYWKTCIPKRCRMEEGTMKPIQLTALLSAYSVIWYSSNGLELMHQYTRSYLLGNPLVCQPQARLGKHSSGKSFTLVFCKIE